MRAIDNTPERVALRQSIAEELYANGGFAQAPAGPRVVIHHGNRADIVIGTPAAGKSSIIESLLREHGALLFDPDEAKFLFREYAQGRGAGLVHMESVQVASNPLLDLAMAKGDNIVWPMVGGRLKQIEDRIDTFLKAGYSVNITYVDLPVEKALARSLLRWVETGRLVPPDLITLVGDGPRRTFEALKKRSDIDDLTYLSNDVPPPASRPSKSSSTEWRTGPDLEQIGDEEEMKGMRRALENLRKSGKLEQRLAEKRVRDAAVRKRRQETETNRMTVDEAAVLARKILEERMAAEKEES